MSQWKVIALPGGNNPDEKGRNARGLVVYLANGSVKEEVGRVAFIRRHGQEPKKPFRKKLDEVLDTATTTADKLNEMGQAPDYGSAVGY